MGKTRGGKTQGPPTGFGSETQATHRFFCSSALAADGQSGCELFSAVT
jgi:hypothetical protein